MGYHGLGMQRWIFTMKPRKFMGKRSKPDGGGGDASRSRDVEDLYHYGDQNLDYFKQKNYSESKRRRLRAKLLKEKHQQNLFLIIGLIVVFVAVTILFIYLSYKLTWF